MTKPIERPIETEEDKKAEPDFYDSPFTELDGRFILGPGEWWEYLHDLDRIRAAGHRYEEPTDFPIYVTTAFLAGQWVHQVLSYRWVSYMKTMKEGLQMGRVETPSRFGSKVRRPGRPALSLKEMWDRGIVVYDRDD